MASWQQIPPTRIHRRKSGQFLYLDVHIIFVRTSVLRSPVGSECRHTILDHLGPASSQSTQDLDTRLDADAAMEPLSCPFCDFTDQDSYFLLQHVELIHPENGESPFIATEQHHNESGSSSDNQKDNEGEAAPQPEQTTPSFASSVELRPTYVECPYHCGELVSSTELTSHTDLHLAENMAFEEEALRPVEFSVGACNDEQAVKHISAHFSTEIPKALRRDTDSPRTATPRKSSLKELLFGGSPLRTPTKVSGGGTRRLGVSSISSYSTPSC